MKAATTIGLFKPAAGPNFPMTINRNLYHNHSRDQYHSKSYSQSLTRSISLDIVRFERKGNEAIGAGGNDGGDDSDMPGMVVVEAKKGGKRPDKLT